MPTVSSLSMDSPMTRMAESHQILLRISAALSQWENMMNHLGRRVSPSPQTFLAQGVSRSIPLTDFSPLGVIPLGCFRIAVPAIIALGL